MDFQSFRFHPHVSAGVTACGYSTPTPIQARAIPVVLSGRDVLGIAQTGTGKTAAFALPMLEKLLKGRRGCIRALIIAPTRELSEQIHENIKALGQAAGARSVTVYGGVGMQPQVEKLRGGAEIVVACPGRLLDHIKNGTINLSCVEVLVLDEADRMFDMGFLPDIRKILKHLPQKRQNLLFSATMPEAIRHLAHEVLKDPETVKVDAAVMADTVTHAFYPVEQESKTPLLMKILEETETKSVLVFTRTKHRASRLAEKLAREGHKAASLQGNLSQGKRLAALNGFKSGAYRVLVATDIAARGIDVATVSHVINYDMPNTVEDYTHRTGRTGRALRSGDAFSLVTREDGAIVKAIEKVLDKKIQRRSLTGLAMPEAVGSIETERKPAKHHWNGAKGRNTGRPQAKNARKTEQSGRAMA